MCSGCISKASVELVERLLHQDLLLDCKDDVALGKMFHFAEDGSGSLGLISLSRSTDAGEGATQSVTVSALHCFHQINEESCYGSILVAL